MDMEIAREEWRDTDNETINSWSVFAALLNGDGGGRRDEVGGAER